MDKIRSRKGAKKIETGEPTVDSPVGAEKCINSSWSNESFPPPESHAALWVHAPSAASLLPDVFELKCWFGGFLI